MKIIIDKGCEDGSGGEINEKNENELTYKYKQSKYYKTM